MILHGTQRSGAAHLAWHLQRTDENEHVEIHEMRGFVSEDLKGAFKEVEAISSGTRCQQYLFSLSLNPPETECVPIGDYEAAIDLVEKKLGLDDQPRAIVFHEKDGRRHAHAVWSRIDIDEMKAVQLAHSKLKLREASREIFFEHGWQMPRGLMNSAERDPTNFTRAEWEMAKRAKRDPRELKEMFQEYWAISDGKATFAAALKERGFTLARGDRRGYVAVDFRGEVFAIPRWTGKRTKEVRVRLGDPQDLPSIEQANAELAVKMTPRLESFAREIEAVHEKRRLELAFKKSQMAQTHATERQRLKDGQEKRWQAETIARQQRLPNGMSGLWSRITGDYQRLRATNETEAWQAHLRDRRQIDNLISVQHRDRVSFRTEVLAARSERAAAHASMEADLAHYRDLVRASPEPQRQQRRRHQQEHAP